MKNFGLLLLLTSLLFSCGKKTELTGTVVNGITNQPIEGAVVKLDATTFLDSCNQYGEFEFSGFQKGTYTIIAKKEGFDEFSKEIIIGDENEKSFYPIALYLTFPDMDQIHKILENQTEKSLKQSDKWRILTQFRITSSNIEQKEATVDTWFEFKNDKKKPGMSLWGLVENYVMKLRYHFVLTETGWIIHKSTKI
jgi:hypothetical protein